MTRLISNDAEAVAFLTELISIPSFSGQERGAVERFIGEMEMYGAAAEVDGAGNGVAAFGEGPHQLLLLGHIDTVPGIIPVRREGSLLYGRGAVDAKGPLAAMAMAAAQLGARPGWQIVVVGAVEEEAASSRGARYLLERYQPRYCIIGEPSTWSRITLGYKGRLLIDYTLEQPIGHTAGRESGGCEQAAAFWQNLLEYCRAYNHGLDVRFAMLDPSLRRMNSSDDGLTERVEMRIGMRLPPHAPLHELLAQLDIWRGEAELRTHGEEQAYIADKRTPLCAAFLAAIRTAGGQPAFVFKTGTSDMNVVGPLWNCPIAAYGPGDSALDHTPREHIDLREYLRSIEVIKAVLSRLTSAASPA
ncbi:MAG: [LysW]-lysine hydrolase [Chloroflexi bacterium]|nr:[LysW]-lysine hydrolase [Chloroflexota bacterium]